MFSAASSLTHRFSLRPLRTGLLVGLLAVTALMGGCSSTRQIVGDINRDRITTFFSPYRMDVVQGNFVSKEQVEALKPGMPRIQVQNILGTPLVASVFHADRWDYVFSFHRQGRPVQSFRLSVFFQGDELLRHEGDEMPSETEFVAKLDARRALGKVPPLEATPEQLKKFANAAPAAAASDAAPATAASGNYPPLER